MYRQLSHSTISRKWCLVGLKISLFAVLASLCLPLRALAQDQDDPPGRVARLGYMQGSVSFQPSGESDWVQPDTNRPMTIGDRLWADRDSRAEVQLGSAAIFVGANTGISFLNLDDQTVQLELSSGVVDVRVRSLDRNDVFEIDTPNEAFTIYQPGRYRIEASEDGNTSVVTIRDGAGEATGDGRTYTIHAGQRTTFTGITPLNAEVEQIASPDDFDEWSYSRESRYENSRSARYCSREVVGYEDLDDYGDWQSNQEYGNVWFPRVSAGWVPYQQGHWTWIDPWGWTWVDDNAWGYAPSHYGRWASVGGRWGWVPGPIVARPIYAPALVVFVGGGSAFSGNVGWFPLAPREVYVPSYRVSRGYVERVNVTNTVVNTTTITNVYNTTVINQRETISRVNYVNRAVPGAVVAVPQRAFASAQPVARSAVAVNAREAASAPATTRVPVAPARQAVLGAHANTANRVPAPPRTVVSRPVIAKATPPAPAPSFATRQAVLESHPGQPLPRQEMQKLHPAQASSTPAVKQAPPGRPATAVRAMNRPDQPINQPPQPTNNSATPTSREPAERNPGQPNARPNDRPPNEPTPNNRPKSNRPESNRSEAPPARSEQPPAPQPNNRPPNQPNNRPEPNRPESNRSEPPPARSERPPAAGQGNASTGKKEPEKQHEPTHQPPQ